MLRLIGYYGSRSVKNQIRKLLRTWVVVFLAACVLLGYLAGSLTAGIASDPPEAGSEDASLFQLPEGVDLLDLTELVTGAAIAGIFLLMLFSADNKGLLIFQPADVPVLFASPQRPQTVLMFRVFCQLGIYLFLTVYLMIEIPALRELLEISAFGAAAIVLTCGLTLITAAFARVGVSLISAAHSGFGRAWRYLLTGAAAGVAGLFLSFWNRSGLDALTAALAFFNAPVTESIPVWGWLRSMMMAAIRGDIPHFLLYLFLNLAVDGLLLLFIRLSKPDFYEEALQKTEELSERAERMKEKGSLFEKGKKTPKKIKREDTLPRDGFRRGRGPVMFFVRAMYDRFRFARFGILTNTLLIDLAVCAAVSLLCRRFTDLGMIVPVLVLCVMVFVRTLGDPLRQDTQNLYFLLAPWSGGSKLLFSALGGLVGCLLDVLPALVISAALLGGTVSETLCSLLLILSLDFFSVFAGSLIHLSLPQNAGATVKQVMQLMFLYFGLVPDALIAVLGILREWETPFILLAAALLNLLLGLAFFGLTVPWVEPRGSLCRFDGVPDADPKEAKRAFSRAGFAAAVYYAVTALAQGVVLALPGPWQSDEGLTGAWLYLCSLVPMYLLGLPAALAVLKSIKSMPPKKERMEPTRILRLIPVIALFAFCGSLLGSLLSALLSALSGGDYTNPVQTILSGQDLRAQILFVVLIGPLAEEFFFRKLLIDRLAPYGERPAILVSALIFGLFHGNLSQLIYAAAIGLVFGYLYVRTGSIRVSYCLHALLNFCSGVVPMWLLSRLDTRTSETADLLTTGLTLGPDSLALVGLCAYYLVMLTLSVLGLTILCAHARDLVFRRAPGELPRSHRLRVALLNPGLILFALMIALVIADSYLTFLRL